MNMGLPSLSPIGSSTQTSTPASSGSSALQGLKAVGGAALSLNNNGGAPVVPKAPVSPAKLPASALPSATTSTYTSGAYTPPASSYTAPVATQAVPTTPSYNPSQPATTVYNNGIGTTNQGGTTVSGYTPPAQGVAANGGNTNTVIPGQLSTYPGIVSGLASSALQGSPAAQGYTAQTAQYGAGNVPIGQEAAAIGQQYGLDYNAATQAGTSQEGHEMTTGGLSGVGEGNAAVTAGVLAQQQQGIAQSANTALQGLGVQETAQNQAANAANEAAGQANTGQGLVQSGLGAAGALAQPSATASGQTTFNPLTGQFSGGSSSADPTQAPSGYTQADWSQIVSNVANGNLSAISGLPTVLQAQAQAAAQAQNPQFNINTAQGAAQGQQAQGAAGGTAAAQNTVTANTTGTNIASQGATQATEAYNTLNAANTQFDGQASQLLGTLKQYSLNGTIPDANSAINSVAGKLGSTGVAALNSAFAETVSAYNGLLASNGGTPTAQDQQAMAALNINSTPAQIATALSQLQSAATIKLGAAKNLASGYGNALGGGSTGNTSTSGFGWGG